MEAAQLFVNLRAAFEELPDPRAANHVHPLINIVVIALAAVVAGANDFTEFTEFGHAKREWLAGILDSEKGIPSHDTFARVFAKLDPCKWQHCFVQWVRYALKGALTAGDVIALDGKCLRGSVSEEERAAYLVNAWSTHKGLCLAQAKVDGKSNEITALPDLIETLDLFDLSGCTVTIDAMGTQREVARSLCNKQAAYVLALKDNQPKLHEDVRWLFENAREHPKQSGYDFCETREQKHGRASTRRCFVLEDASFLEPHDWPGLKSVVLVEHDCTRKGVTSSEKRYYLSSLSAPALTFMDVIRSHWQVENNLHWVLDVIFNEDNHRAKKDHAPANLAVLRPFALNLLRSTPPPKPKLSLKNLRKRAGWDTSFLEEVLAEL